MMLAPPNDVGLPVFSVFATAKHRSRSDIFAEGTSFCRQANLIRVASFETHDTLDMGHKVKRYIFVSKTGIVKPKSPQTIGQK